MIDASEIVNNLVAMLRDVPALVTELGNDVTSIYAYHDSYPKNVSLAHALHQMASPSIMVVWQGTQPGSFGGVDVWKHQITLFLRAKEEASAGTAYYRLFRLASKEARPAPGHGFQKHRRIWNFPHSLAAQSCYGNYFWQLLSIKGNRF